jgi:hypothetical protein
MFDIQFIGKLRHFFANFVFIKNNFRFFKPHHDRPSKIISNPANYDGNQLFSSDF